MSNGEIVPSLLALGQISKMYLSRNNQQMSRHSTLFPFYYINFSDTFLVHHLDINKIN
jgi:hypothetical protein